MLRGNNKFFFNIFVILEKMPLLIYNSNTLTPNHHLIISNIHWIYLFNLILRKELILKHLYLIEITAIDTLYYNFVIDKNLKNINVSYKNARLIPQYSYFNYSNKLRLTLFSNNQKKNTQSIDVIYKNAHWLEREVSEMFPIKYNNKIDSRSLLLDYSKNEYPLLKDFPTEGFNELYYDFFDSNTNYVVSEHIEL